MCNHCTNLDPRDEIVYAAIALDGIRHLVSDVGVDKPQFDLTGPRELAELLDMVHKRISGAADKLQGYVPRDWTPPVA
jgi:hypothetical protein